MILVSGSVPTFSSWTAAAVCASWELDEGENAVTGVQGSHDIIKGAAAAVLSKQRETLKRSDSLYAW
jgi:hypothetical protein